MFNKKIKLFLIALVFMLSISAVVAADSNSTDDVITDDIDEEPPSVSAEDINASDLLSATNDDVDENLSSDNSTMLSSSSGNLANSKLISGKDLTKSYDGKISYYQATFYDVDGKVLKNTDVNFTINCLLHHS